MIDFQLESITARVFAAKSTADLLSSRM